MGRRRSSRDDHDRHPGPAARGLPLPDRPGHLHRRHQPAAPALTPISCAARTPMRGSPASTHRPRPSAPGVVAVYTGEDMAADGVGGLPCGWQVHSKDGSPMAEPPHPVLAQEPRAPCRRPGRRRHRRDPRPGARGRRAGARRLCRGARRRRSGRGVEARRAAGLRRGAGQYLLRLAYRRPGRGRCRLRQGGARRQARPRQQPARPQRDGAARRDRRVRPRHRRLHALHDQPEPACDPPVDGRLRAAHPRGEIARRRARCRRRLRLEDLPLRRGGDRHLGRRQSCGGRSNGPPSAPRASCPTRMAATT